MGWLGYLSLFRLTQPIQPNKLNQLVMSRCYLLVCLLFVSSALFAQSTTRTSDTATDVKTTGANGKTNVLIIPWSPKMFNGSSDVTRDISTNSGESYNTIQEAFRWGMCMQMKATFSTAYNATTLLDDTASMKVDLMYVYNVTTTEYIYVNAPLNPDPAPKKDIKDGATVSTTGIKNGQIQVEQQEGEKFMNAVIISPNLLDHLKKTYKCEYVVFLNQLDMQNELGSDGFNTAGSTDFKRSSALHWTIFSTTTKKRIAMGKNKATFSNTLKTTRKIMDASFGLVSKAVYDKFVIAITPKK